MDKVKIIEKLNPDMERIAQFADKEEKEYNFAGLFVAFLCLIIVTKVVVEMVVNG